MLENKGRILIPKNFMVEEEAKAEKVYFYYSTEKHLFYILFKKTSGGFLIGEGNIDSDSRIEVPELVKEAYCTETIFCAEKEDRIYLVPFKKN